MPIFHALLIGTVILAVIVFWCISRRNAALSAVNKLLATQAANTNQELLKSQETIRKTEMLRGRMEAELSNSRTEIAGLSSELSSAKASLNRETETLRKSEADLENLRAETREAVAKAERLTVECCVLRLREDTVIQWQTRGIVMTPEFKAALKVVLDPVDRNPVFISGPAGTGKSVLIGLDTLIYLPSKKPLQNHHSTLT